MRPRGMASTPGGGGRPPHGNDRRFSRRLPDALYRTDTVDPGGLMPLTTEDTTFTRDVLGRYICNTFDEMLVTVDPNAHAAAGLPARGDLRPFDFIIIGGGTFGAALAEHLW